MLHCVTFTIGQEDANALNKRLPNGVDRAESGDQYELQVNYDHGAIQCKLSPLSFGKPSYTTYWENLSIFPSAVAVTPWIAGCTYNESLDVASLFLPGFASWSVFTDTVFFLNVCDSLLDVFAKQLPAGGFPSDKYFYSEWDGMVSRLRFDSFNEELGADRCDGAVDNRLFIFTKNFAYVYRNFCESGRFLYRSPSYGSVLTVDDDGNVSAHQGALIDYDDFPGFLELSFPNIVSLVKDGFSLHPLLFLAGLCDLVAFLGLLNRPSSEHIRILSDLITFTRQVHGFLSSVCRADGSVLTSSPIDCCSDCSGSSNNGSDGGSEIENIHNSNVKKVPNDKQ